MSTQLRTEFPSRHTNERTFHVIYVRPEEVEDAYSFLKEYNKVHLVIEPTEDSKYSRLICDIGNNVFYHKKIDACIFEQSWFLGNKII